MDNKLYVQWSHGNIPKSYFQNGKYPSGYESEWLWENQYIPLPHYVNNTLVSKHIYRREKVGINGFWTAPIPISVNEDDIKLAIKELNLGFDFDSFPLVNTINSTDKLYINNGNNSAILYSTIKQDILSSVSSSNKILTSVDITTTFNNSNNHLYTTFNPISIDYLYNNILKTITIGGSYDIGLYSSTGLSRLVYYTIIPSTNTLGIYQGDESASPEQPTIPINDFILGYTLVTDNNTTNILYTENVIYVGKGGYDTDNGNSLNTRVATFTKSLQLKTLHPEYSIVCLDSSYFNENVSIDLDSYSLEIFAPNAEFNGTWTCTGDSTMSVNIRRHYGTINITNEGTIVLNNSTILNNLTLNLSAKLKCGYSEITNLTANDNTSIYCSHIRGTFSYSDLNNLTVKGRINDIYYPSIVVDATELVKGIAKLSDQTNAEDAATNATITNINDTYIITPRKLRYFWEKIKTIQLFGHKILGNGTLYTDRSKLDFVNSNGNEFTITDDSVNDKTIVNISKSGIGTKSVDETGLTNNYFPYYDSISGAYKVKDFTPIENSLSGWVTVGTNGQYASLQAAYDAGKRNLLVISNLTLTQDQVLGQNLNIIAAYKGITITCGNYSLGTSLLNSYVFGITFTTALQNGKSFTATSFSTGSDTTFKNCIITDTGVSIHNFFQCRFEDTKLTCANADINFRLSSFKDCELAGGGASCIIGSQLSGAPVIFEGYTIFSGTFPSINNACDFSKSHKIEASGLTYIVVGSSFKLVESVNGTSTILKYAVPTEADTNNISITNSTFNSLSKYNNDNTTSVYFKFTNVHFASTTTQTLTGLKAKFVNCSFASSLIIPSGADCQFYNCQIGQTTGSKTITFDSGSNGCFIDSKESGIVLNSTFIKIEGGEHTTIAVNGNNNIITGIRKSTSIVLGSVTGNIVTDNLCDTDIINVAGNEFANNVTY
jgi:hypothetical protein